MADKKKGTAKKTAKTAVVKTGLTKKNVKAKKETPAKIKKTTVSKSERLLTAEGWKRKKSREAALTRKKIKK